jgi:hypothetical protein
LVVAFDFRRQFVLSGTHAEYDRCIEAVTMQRPITGEGVSPDVTSNNRRCAPAVILTDFAMMKNAADLPDVSTIGSKRRFRRPIYFAWGCFRYFWRQPQRPGVTAEHPA